MSKALLDLLHTVKNMDGLDRVYTLLRESWQTNWMTLPTVLATCQHYLFNQTSNLESPTKCLLETAKLVAQSIEQASQEGDEPAYHSRLHIADALVSLAVLIKLQSENQKTAPPEWMACLLLAVSAHDFKHPGGANANPHEIESHSWSLLQPMFQQQAVDAHWQSMLQALILRTDPSEVSHNHDLVRDLEFAWSLDWACVLLNEADILASVSLVHGPALSEALAQEWRRVDHPLHSVVGTAAGRQHFLKSIQFSSYASRALGIEQVVQQQLHSI